MASVSDEFLHHVQRMLAPEYDVTRELGRGGMAVVFSATHRRLARPVAIKLLPPAFTHSASSRERFVREARLTAALDHPGIVPVYAAATSGDLAYFVMALVDGESLGDRLEREGRLSIADARSMLVDVADALRYAHDAGVVHRDIKPDNILIDRSTGRPLLTDFGVARALDDDTRMTRDGVPLGTPSYMAPEQALGEPDVDHRADIYALGVVGYQMLTGRLPFTAATTEALLTKHVFRRPVSLLELRADVPVAMAAAIERAMEKKPAARWSSAAEFAAALGEPLGSVRPLAIYRGGSAQSIEPRAGVLQRRISRFRRKFVGSLVLTGILGVLNVAYDPDSLLFLSIAALLALDLLIMGSALYAEDVSVRELLLANWESADRGEHRDLEGNLIGRRYSARYEAAQRKASTDHAEIQRLLHGCSEHERALIPDAAEVVDQLHHQVRGLANELRSLDQQMDVETDLTGSVMQRLDSAVDALHEVRLGLMNLREIGFEKGLERFALSEQRAQSLTLGRDSTDARLSR